jgi:hypothetical protein
MKPMFRTSVWACVVGTALLTACGGGGDKHGWHADAPATDVAVTPPAVTVAVPAEVSTSPVAATNYVASLSSQPEASTDTLDPVEVPEQVAQDDTSEPV